MTYRSIMVVNSLSLLLSVTSSHSEASFAAIKGLYFIMKSVSCVADKFVWQHDLQG